MGGKMNHSDWNWAKLNTNQLEQLKEGEETLNVDFLLAYEEDDRSDAQMMEAFRTGLQTADLDESQLECLQGLETNLGAVVIAYKSA
jgi:hypothetical protein